LNLLSELSILDKLLVKYYSQHKGDAVILALLDQSAAFDTIDHDILLDRLSARFGISGTALSWFTSYLSDKRQSVSVSGFPSSPCSLLYGVPQGSVLGPILNVLYISPMHDIIASTGIFDHYYADDTQEYQSFHLKPGAIDQQLAFSCLSASITEQKKWLSKNQLKLNAEKIDALLLSSPSNVKSLVSCPLELGDALIIPSPVVRNLGVLLDSHLIMDHQIRSSCRKAYFHLRRIAKIKRFLLRPAICQLVRAFVISQLDYGNSLLVGLPNSQLERLQRVQNSAARLIFGARRFDHITPILRTLHWLPIKQRIKFKIAVLVIRCLIGVAPQYLIDAIAIRRPCRELLSSSQLLLHSLSSRTKTYGYRSFSLLLLVFGTRFQLICVYWQSTPTLLLFL
jgi:hypothetical protein